MGETKTRKKMYKSGKFWVAAGLTATFSGGGFLSATNSAFGQGCFG